MDDACRPQQVGQLAPHASRLRACRDVLLLGALVWPLVPLSLGPLLLLSAWSRASFRRVFAFSSSLDSFVILLLAMVSSAVTRLTSWLWWTLGSAIAALRPSAVSTASSSSFFVLVSLFSRTCLDRLSKASWVWRESLSARASSRDFVLLASSSFVPEEHGVRTLLGLLLHAFCTRPHVGDVERVHWVGGRRCPQGGGFG